MSFAGLELLVERAVGRRHRTKHSTKLLGVWWVARLKFSISLANFKILKFFNLWAHDKCAEHCHFSSFKWVAGSNSVVLQVILAQAVSKDFQEHSSITTLVVVRAGQTIMQRIKRGPMSAHEFCRARAPCGESSWEAAPHEALNQTLELQSPLPGTGVLTGKSL